MIKKVSILFLGIFYVIAGVNHFINPEFYHPLIPDYLPAHNLINYTSGIIEVLLGLGVFYFKTRSKAALAIVLLLFLFIPSHIHFIQIGGCISDGLCVPLWIAWARLILIHPLLMFWAYYVSKN